MGVKAHLSFLRAIYKLEINTAMEYRFNFISQTIGMFVNDIFWIFFWFLIFQKFGSIGNWGYHEMLLLYAVLPTSFGLVMILFGNWAYLSKMIEEGNLDYYLTLPKNELLHILIKSRYSGMGDVLFGLGLAVFTLSLNQVPLFVVMVVSSGLILLGWTLFTNSFSFYVGRFQDAARAAREAIIIVSGYPFSVYSGATKFILLFIIPAGFVAGVPVELLTHFSMKWFLITVGFSLAFFAFSVWFFYNGLKRYESGNMLAMRG
ncbi:MAG: ABC-2 family transporter protein [Nanoarchaeota archaeon]